MSSHPEFLEPGLMNEYDPRRETKPPGGVRRQGEPPARANLPPDGFGPARPVLERVVGGMQPGRLILACSHRRPDDAGHRGCG